MRIPLTLLIALASFTGCGFKGPLYMPVRTNEAAKPAAPPVPAVIPPSEDRPVPSDAVPTPK